MDVSPQTLDPGFLYLLLSGLYEFVCKKLIVHKANKVNYHVDNLLDLISYGGDLFLNIQAADPQMRNFG